MRDVHFPARGYDAAPDWNDLRVDFAGSGLLHWKVSMERVNRHAWGRFAFLAVPYAELTTGRAMVAQQAAEWRAQLLPDLVTVSPAADVETMIESGRASVSPANNPARWRSMVQRYLNETHAVIIPPIDGWQNSQEIYQIAGTALCALRPVFVIKGGK